jgi:hypothetical protein
MLKSTVNNKTGEQTQELVAWDYDAHAENHAKNAAWRARKDDAKKERTAERIANASEILKLSPALLSELVDKHIVKHEHAIAAGWKPKGKK